MKQCKHPCCGEECRKPPKEKKVYTLKRSPLKKKRFVGYTKKADCTMKLQELLDLAQALVNKLVRLRDKDKGCISCGDKVEHAGHYFPQGTYSGVRLDEDNENGQCEHCNITLEGNLRAYQYGFIKRYGINKFHDLAERAERTKFYKWSRSEVLQRIEEVREKLKTLEN